jgi:hypothetical protein
MQEEPENEGPAKTLTIRMSTVELVFLEKLRRRLQAKAPTGVRVTQRMTIMAALERLEAHLDKLDRDKNRDR